MVARISLPFCGVISLALPLLLVPGSAAAQTACGSTLQSLVDAAPPGATVLVPACTYHEAVTVSHAVTLDGQNQAVVTGDNTRDRWFWIAASDVTIKNFTMTAAKTALQEGALATAAGISNVTIDHNDLSNTLNGDPIAIGGTSSSKVTNNQIHGGGQLGIETFQNTGLLIQGNHVFGNNTAGVDPNFGAGGIKAVADTNSQIVGNEVDHNAGPGIWCDIGCNGETIASNFVHDQAFTPITYEISSNGDIHDNTVTSADSSPFPGGDWACIFDSSSGDLAIHNNTCTDTLPITAQLLVRSDAPADAGTNVHITSNTAVRPIDPAQATLWQAPLVPGTSGNLDQGNVAE